MRVKRGSVMPKNGQKWSAMVGHRAHCRGGRKRAGLAIPRGELFGPFRHLGQGCTKLVFSDELRLFSREFSRFSSTAIVTYPTY
jgi:hypothetical protein